MSELGHRKTIRQRVHAPVEEAGAEKAPVRAVVAVFDEAERLLALRALDDDRAALELSDEYVGKPVRVVRSLLQEEIRKPTLERLRRNSAVEDVLVVDPEREWKLPKVPLEHLRHSWCLVRGRVVTTVTLPNGTVQQRPLCNARVTICEVDVSLPWLIRRLPNELVYRVRDELLEELSSPRPRPFPPAPDLASHPLHDLAGEQSVEAIQERLISHLDLVLPHWCRFDWLRAFYTVNCLRTVLADDSGNFSALIWHPAYSDPPDLYFRVEQDCHPGWLTIYAPPVHCNTHWNYRCGTRITISVSHPQAVPGRLQTPCVFPYAPSDPASVGSWQLLPYTSGVFVVHAALLRTGKVVLWSGTAEVGLPLQSRVWDPATGTMTSQAYAEDLFCSGHAMLPDGRVLVVGGASSPGQGIRSTHIFDPVAETWTKVADMAFARWYPTAVTLPNGRIAVFSGRATGAPIDEVEIYDPSAGTWTTLPSGANKSLEIYPSLHVMPDGKILYTGTRWSGAPAWGSPPSSALLDVAAPTPSWTNVGAHVLPNRTEGFSVLLPALTGIPGPELEEMGAPPTAPTLSRVLVVGGGSGTAGGGAADDQKAAEIIDMADATPAWRRITDMTFRRTNVNGVLLPDGMVLFCTGIDGYKWSPAGGTLAAELFDPQTEAWTTAASMSVARQYHSVSLLLPDGRVLNTGSVGATGNLMSMEVYSPPYLFRGPRPSITGYPASVGYGAEFTIDSPDACRVDRVSLVRVSSITHHTNTDQRYLRLEWRRDGRCRLRATAPANAAGAPPGYYLLFVLDDCGVPSVGRFVLVG